MLLHAVHVHEQPLDAVGGALSEHGIGEVEEVDPRGQQQGAEHGGLEPGAGHAQQAQLHVRVLDLRGRLRQRGGATERAVNPWQLAGAISRGSG